MRSLSSSCVVLRAPASWRTLLGSSDFRSATSFIADKAGIWDSDLKVQICAALRCAALLLAHVLGSFLVHRAAPACHCQPLTNLLPPPLRVRQDLSRMLSTNTTMSKLVAVLGQLAPPHSLRTPLACRFHRPPRSHRPPTAPQPRSSSHGRLAPMHRRPHRPPQRHCP